MVSVSFSREGIAIDGQPVIVLASSLFYFRIPRGQWRDRMIKIRQAGYSAVDVYFPWNHHELAEGKWNFHGERDASEFLHQAAEAGLWVIARPGPYICSEWDGGGLPAYLFTKPGLRLRDNDPRFLKYVQKWFDHILPILAAFQVGRGGSVIAVQLENELDFYDCQDRAGYLEALRDMAREEGIQVPLIACAGQGDLYGASGGARGVVPTCNIYNGELDPGVEQRAFALGEQLQVRGLPLCVTETNRSHFYLRRLLSAGAKLLGPYLQAGGVNFGFTNAVNNWGSPLSFITSDYDFGGMVGPGGELSAEEQEAVLFARTIGALGPALARATAARLPAGTVLGIVSGRAQADGASGRAQADGASGWAQPDAMPLADEGPFALNLAGGGQILSLPNLTARPQTARVRLDGQEFPCHSELVIEPGRCLLLPTGIDLQAWGLPGRLVYATAELALAQPVENGLALVFYADGTGEIGLELPEEAAWAAQQLRRQSPTTAQSETAAEAVTAEGMHVFCKDSYCAFTFTGSEHGGHQPARARVAHPDGRALYLYGLGRRDAARAVVDDSGQVSILAGPASGVEKELDLAWHAQPLERLASGLAFHPAPGGDGKPSFGPAGRGGDGKPSFGPAGREGDRAPFLEEMGILRGYGWYRARVRGLENAPVRGYLLQNAADVLSLYAGGRYIGTVTPGGGSVYLAVQAEPEGTEEAELEVRAEIWGHSNFDDSRQPALRLGSLRGLTGVVAVLREQDLTANWYVHQLNESENRNLYAAPDFNTANLPLVSFAGWLSTHSPNRVCYRKRIHISDGPADRWVLSFPGLTRPVEVSVCGSPFARVNPLDAFIDITPQLSASCANKQPVDLVVYAEQDYHGQLAGRVTLLEGKAAGDWQVGGMDETGLWTLLAAATAPAAITLSAGAGEDAPAAFPLRAAPGEMALLWACLPSTDRDCVLYCEAGQGAKLSVFFDGHLVGRVWLNPDESFPRLAGGNPARVYLPGAWSHPESRLLVMLEAIGPQAEVGPFKVFVRQENG